MKTKPMNVVPQNPPKPKLTEWEMVKRSLEIRIQCEFKTIEKLITELQRNPKQALAYSGSAFTAAARYDIFKKLEGWADRWIAENKTAEKWLECILEYIQEEFMRVAKYESFCSTSMASNLSEESYRVALAWSKDEIYRIQCSVVEFSK